MEKVRKGKGLTEEHEKLMREHGVPDWYIDSCKKIKYMFPRAHAVAYVMMSYRIAYYKVYYPPEFYAVYFTTKAADFNEKVILKGSSAIQAVSYTHLSSGILGRIGHCPDGKAGYANSYQLRIPLPTAAGKRL